MNKITKGYRFLFSFLLLIHLFILGFELEVSYPVIKFSSKEIPEKISIIYILSITGLIFGKNPTDKIATLIGETLEVHILEKRKKNQKD